MIEKQDFGNRVAALRNACGLSQNRLSAMLCVSPQAVSKWETGVSLPDIELLLPLAQALGVDADALLGAKRGEAIHDAALVRENLLGYDIPDETAHVLSAVSGRLTRKQLYQCARLAEGEKLRFRLAMQAVSIDGDGEHIIEKQLDAKTLSPATLEGLAAPLADLAIRAVNRETDPVAELTGIFRCPACGGGLEYTKTSGEGSLSCGAHSWRIIEGVVDFGTFEQHGNTWSSWIRSYDDYLTKFGDIFDVGDALYQKYGLAAAGLLENILERRPAVLLEVGSGLASFISLLLDRIDWPCTVILTDLSHRVLKYNKRRFDEGTQNPNVNLVYLACDARGLPMRDGAVDMALSFGGFENMSGDIAASVAEARRVVKSGGWLNASLSLVKDRRAPDTRQWLRLIGESPDPDAPAFLRSIFDLEEWRGILRDMGFTQNDIRIVYAEEPPPETDKFPYTFEIARWMAGAVVTAVK